MYDKLHSESIAVPKERWLEAVEELSEVAEIMANYLRNKNYEGQGATDAEEFLLDMELAFAAMRYVSEFATDKCRFVKEREGE